MRTAFNSTVLWRIISIVLASVAVGGCGSSSAIDIAGTWSLSTADCDGTPVPFTNYQTSTTYTADGKVTSIETTSNGCQNKATGTFAIDGGVLAVAWQTSECVASQCNLDFTYNGQTVSEPCGTQATGGGGTVSVSGNTLTVSQSASGQTCEVKFVKTAR